jgi:hypothetical protein
MASRNGRHGIVRQQAGTPRRFMAQKIEPIVMERIINEMRLK